MHTFITAMVLLAVIFGFALLAHLIRFKGDYTDHGL